MLTRDDTGDIIPKSQKPDNISRDDDCLAGGCCLFQSTLCASAGPILVGLLGRKN